MPLITCPYPEHQGVQRSLRCKAKDEPACCRNRAPPPRCACGRHRSSRRCGDAPRAAASFCPPPAGYPASSAAQTPPCMADAGPYARACRFGWHKCTCFAGEALAIAICTSRSIGIPVKGISRLGGAGEGIENQLCSGGEATTLRTGGCAGLVSPSSRTQADLCVRCMRNYCSFSHNGSTEEEDEFRVITCHLQMQ